MPDAVSNRPPLRTWQERALERWEEDGRKGIVSAVTGSGKTFMALSAIERAPEDTVLIVVPTVPLLEQWWACVRANSSSEMIGSTWVRSHSELGRRRLVLVLRL